ncbi:MAG: site-specific integrase [Muribaculaceae bacterium]|nr:site-specific integrase [Muribaculaceae bacterium]
MANFKAVVRGERKDGFMQVYIRVTHHRMQGYIKTDKMITKRELTKTKEIKDPYVLTWANERILEYNARLNRKDISKWRVSDVVEFLKSGDDDLSFSEYARLHIDRLIDNGQMRTAQNYRRALGHMERFYGTTKIMFSQLTSSQLNRWILSLEQTHRAKEMYPVCIRQVFKAAVKEYNDYEKEVIRIKSNPWGKVQIPQSDRTTKRAISPEECRIFFNAPLPRTKFMSSLPELGRDVAKMVLCLAGMNTIDIYELRKEDYRNGCLCYNRAKTKKFRADDAYFEIRVEPIMQELIEKYRSKKKNDPYLLSFHERFSTPDSFNANVNNGIKQMCESLGIPKDKWYCVYTFRHTWGTVAQNDCGASISEVAFGMNHSHGHNITRGYIKIDFTPAWELNAKVIDFIFFSTAKSKQGMARSVEEPQGKLFRLSPKRMVYARAYFRGEILAEVSDIGFGTVEEVIDRLTPQLPTTIPEGCAVQFRIRDVDAEREAVYERTKGKSF